MKGHLETETLEQMNPKWRAILERAYAADPRATHADLTELGRRTVATQLKVDHEMGRIVPSEPPLKPHVPFPCICLDVYDERCPASTHDYP